MSRPPSDKLARATELDSRLIATMRLVLSSSVLFIIGPSEIDNLGAFHVLAALYIVYSAGIYLYAERTVPAWISSILYWIDLVWAAVLTGLGDDSTIAFLFLFPTLAASFQWKFVSALRLTLVAAITLVAISVLIPLEDTLNLTTILLPPVDLVVFGCLVAIWGDREITARRRLVLLKETSRLSNPRFGIERMIGGMMERLRAFYNADSCLLIVIDEANGEYLLRRADAQSGGQPIPAEPIPALTAELLLRPPAEQAVLYMGPQRAWERWRARANYYVFDVRDGCRLSNSTSIDESLIAIVDADSFISVPLQYSDSAIGRLYLTAARRQAFTPSDVLFLLQVIEQIVPVIENIRLVDQLASSAAEEERRRLARDIHDNVIQPYIGLQIGLAAVSQKLQNGNAGVTQDIAQLMAICGDEVEALRRYIHELPGSGRREHSLPAAVRRFSATFAEATHIAVEVEHDSNLQLNDRLAAEVFQVIVEGLSNIRRHTQATHANITLDCQAERLVVRIANDDLNGVVPKQFVPRSISERVSALGGHACVEPIRTGGAQVIVDIPL